MILILLPVKQTGLLLGANQVKNCVARGDDYTCTTFLIDPISEAVKYRDFCANVPNLYGSFCKQQKVTRHRSLLGGKSCSEDRKVIELYKSDYFKLVCNPLN